MKISVITVCRNAAATIVDTLQSVARQSHPDVEHIVVDGASTDATVALVRAHGARLARLVSEPDRGLFDAMNKGIALATGELVGFLNADDVYATDDALAQIAAACADPAVDACYADLVYVRADDLRRVVRYWKSGPFRAGLARRGWMPPHPTFYARRSVYAAHGGFDLRFPRQADFELTTRLLEVRRIRAVHIPHILVRMRVGGASNNSVRNILRGNLEAYRACRMHGLAVGPLFIARKILSRVPQFLARPPAGALPDGSQ